MNRLTLVLIALVGGLAGAFGFAQFNRPAPPMDAQAVRAIVEDVLAARETAASQDVAALDPEVLNPMIETYLLSEPKLLQRMSDALDETLENEKQTRTQAAIAEMHDAIYNDPNHVVLGNPDGDVTLVEFFDYNCGYCRVAVPDMAALLAEDPQLKVILKEFPILSEGSMEAARIGVLVGQSDVDYWSFHEALFTSRGQIDKAAALKAAQDLGMSPVSLELQMNEERVAQQIQTSYTIARALEITGTPAYILGDEVISGAVGLDNLRMFIANIRECGATNCG